jgi:hypothetical protein
MLTVSNYWRYGLALLLTLSPAVSRAHPGHAHPHGQSTGTEEVAAAVNHRVEITVRGEHRLISSNGIPNHETGRFPNRGNPNSISPQDYDFRVPAKPQIAKTLTPLQHQPFGVAINGVVFDPGTAEFWQNDRRSGWNYEALSGQINLGLDRNQAHVQPSGAYHYHGVPTGLIEVLGGNAKQMLLLGYAADGFPIYAPRAHAEASNAESPLKSMKSSYRVKQGQREGGPGGKYDGTFVQDYEYVAGLGDLDEANGRTGVTPEYPEGTYYYVLTEEYPFIPRNYRGTPDASFERRGPPPGGPGGPGGPGPGGPPPGRPPFPPGGRRPPR